MSAGPSSTVPVATKPQRTGAARGKKAAPAGTPRVAVRRKPAADTATPETREPSACAPATAAPEPAQARRLVSDEEIRVRAYFLSLEHRGAGSDVDFWLLAERELRPDAQVSE